MPSRAYSDTGVVLFRRNYGEGDRILSLLSENYGRVHVIAHGVRKLKSRKRGHLEVFNYIRFQAVRSRGDLDLITEAEVIDDFKGLRTNLAKVSVAYYFMEVIGRVSRENEPHREVFNFLLGYLKKLETRGDLKALRLNFARELLILLGFWPKDKPLGDPDAKLEEIIERNLFSIRVGKKLTS